MTENKGKNFSVIIPVYNRPDELSGLLECLARQTYPPYEVIVVEDGSAISSEEVVDSYRNRLPVSYFLKENGGQGFARNYGMERAKGDYFIFFDSDALIEADYLEIVNKYLSQNPVDLYGGPDTDHPDFTPLQKAISYSMTSLFTTGGIRGRKKNLGGTFHPRSFNMGLSREVWEKTGGFQVTRMGEDIIFSITAIRMGFRTALIPEAFIYHKRRTRIRQFYRQLHFFGRARINIARFYPEELKAVHCFPSLFFLGWVSLPVLAFTLTPLFRLGTLLYLLYFILLFLDALNVTRNLRVALLSLLTSFVQLTAYGIGFLEEGWHRLGEDKDRKVTGTQLEYPS